MRTARTKMLMGRSHPFSVQVSLIITLLGKLSSRLSPFSKVDIKGI